MHVHDLESHKFVIEPLVKVKNVEDEELAKEVNHKNEDTNEEDPDKFNYTFYSSFFLVLLVLSFGIAYILLYYICAHNTSTCVLFVFVTIFSLHGSLVILDNMDFFSKFKSFQIMQLKCFSYGYVGISYGAH